MRADRLITTLLLLQQRGRLTSRTLAEALEVSPRTVMRDIEALGAAGIPVYAIRGPDGGYQLWDGFRADFNGLTADELGSLPLWTHPLAAGLFGLGEALQRAKLKLALALPADAAQAMADTQHLFLHDPESTLKPDRTILQFLAAAILRGRVVTATWSDEAEPAVFYPLALVDRAGEWHLVADTEAERTVFRISTLTGLRNTGRRFHRPDDFDLVTFWQEWSDRST